MRVAAAAVLLALALALALPAGAAAPPTREPGELVLYLSPANGFLPLRGLCGLRPIRYGQKEQLIVVQRRTSASFSAQRRQ